MTTFNITRRNNQADSNILLLGIVVVALLAVIVAFSPAFLSSPVVSFEGAPFNFNNPEGGNFVSTTLDNRLDGVGGVDSAVYIGKDKWEVRAINDSQAVDGEGSSVSGSCAGFTLPDNATDLGDGNFLIGQAGSTSVIYDSTANLLVFFSNGVVVVFDPATCTTLEKKLVG